MSELGILNAILIIIQLTLASILVIYLDEMLTLGYGVGSGQNLFLATNICEQFFWKLFSPITIKTSAGVQFEGIIIAFYHFLIQKRNFFTALKLALFRGHLTNLSSIFITLGLFLIVFYIQDLKVRLPLVSKKQKGFGFDYTIKLFYLSNTPLIIMTQLI